MTSHQLKMGVNSNEGILEVKIISKAYFMRSNFNDKKGGSE
jgi:hypothetical protein